MSATSNGGRPSMPHGASEDTLWEAEQREDAPLLSSASATDEPTETEEVDATTIYTQILQEQLPWYKRPSPLWLFPLYGIASLSSGMLSTSLGQFETALLCREYLNRYPPSNSTMMTAATATTELTFGLLNTMANSTVLPSSMTGPVAAFLPAPECLAPEIQAFTAKSLGVMQFLGAICGTLSIGYYGSLSDKHGRIRLMMLGCASNLLMLCFLSAMGKWWDQIGYPTLFIMAIMGGLLGGQGLSATMSFAYAADCTPTSERTLMFSRLYAGLFLGLSIGPLLGSLLYTFTDNFMILVGICVVSTLISGTFITFAVPESLPSRQSAHIQRLYEKAIGPKGMQAAASSKRSRENVAWHSHVIRSMRFFKPNGYNTNFIILAAINFLQTLALNGTFSILILYTNKVFNWTNFEDGIMFSLGSTVRLVSLLILLPVLVHAFHKWNDKKRQAQAAQPTPHKGPNKFDILYNDNTASSTIDHNSHPWADRQDRNDIDNNSINDGTLIGGHPERILIGVDNPIAASSIEHLGEAALNLSDDEESFPERRRRQSSVDPAVTLTAKNSNKSSGSASTPHYSSTPSSSRKKSVGSDSTTCQTERSKTEKARDNLKLDTWILRLGFIINSTTYIGYGIANETWQFYMWSALHAISIISAPSLKSLITSQVEPSQFGAVLGAVQVLDSMSGILSPIVISWVYALTVDTRPEFVWYTCAALTGVCAVLAFMIRQRQFGLRAPDV
ncbi:hypothetical protein BGX29_008060 [Mortierella sp. GBA35]|nr:hypothetical protein BGX29_008060 [Mortierella sp. GBA35]